MNISGAGVLNAKQHFVLRYPFLPLCHFYSTYAHKGTKFGLLEDEDSTGEEDYKVELGELKIKHRQEASKHIENDNR